MDLQTIAKGQTNYPISAIRNDRQLIQSIQMALNQMGFSAGQVDGVWNAATDTAFQSFVQYYGFPAGVIAPGTARFIVSSVGVAVPPVTPTPVPTPRPIPTPTPTPVPTPVGTGVFNEALAFSLRWEGGYVNDPFDYGGETNKGITAATYNDYRRKRGLATQSVRYITDAEVKDIYRNLYWTPAKCDDQVRPLAIVHFDTAVNFGVGGAILFLQEVLGVPADGGYGPVTKAALSKANNSSTARRYCQARMAYRQQRVRQDPSQQRFLAGWLNRDNDLLNYISKM
jgi:hypothetical protein